jgi:predicted small integral membrane protein
MAFTSQQGLDYSNPPPGCAFTIKTCDDPAASIGALSDLHFSDFFHQHPFMGPLTLVVRAPVVAAAEAAGAGVKAQYQWGAFVCLLLVGVFAVWLAMLTAERGWPFWLQALIAVGTVANPVTAATLKWGHPEELVTAALTMAALICAVRRQPRAAGVLFGLALASKAWAVLALPALIAVLMPGAWRRAIVPMVVVAGILIVPTAVGAPAHFRGNLTEVSKLGSQYGTLAPTNALWPFGKVVDVATTHGNGQAAKLPLGIARGARLFVFAAALLLTLAWVRLGGRDLPETVLLLVALILMVRGLFDPSNHSYYHTGPFLGLLSYEALTRRTFPFATAAFLLVFEATNRIVRSVHTLDGVNLVYLAWAVPFALYMAGELLSRSHGARAPVHRETRLSPGKAGL